MRKFWWMAALAAAAILLWQMRLPLLQRFTPAPALLSDAPAQAIELPRAVPERLWADLEGLSFKRYREAERAQARLYIQQRLEVAGWQTQLQPFAGGVNLVAERQGSDPSLGAILLGAHYDTVEVAPGADDNATAVAALLEAARLLKPPTPRTLQLVFFDLEERGLLGSKPFVEQLSPKSVQAAVVLDMIGYRCDQPGCQSYPPLLPMQPPTDRGDFLAVLGDQSHADLLKYFTAGTASGNASGNASGAQVLPPVITLAIPTLGGLAPDLVRSDHAPFWNKGIGAVLVSDTANFRNPNYHQASDTLETIDPDFFVGSAQIVISAVAQMLQN